MAAVPRLRPIDHEERLTLVDHLGELRTRILVAVGAFMLASSVAWWQNHEVLEIVYRPLPDNIPEPITFGVTEPFTTTLSNSAYFGLLASLPVILYQFYAFVLPAFSPKERKVATPLIAMIPFLFIGGVAFCYFVVLPPATDFLLSFNADEFNTQIRARDYTSFVLLTMAAMGIGFQVPVAILAAVRLGITTPEQLRKNRRYAILVIAVLAAFLPTIDPITLILEMVPLILLFELSIVLSAALQGREAKAAAREAAEATDREEVPDPPS